MSIRSGWDERSSYRDQPRGYTTIKQYRIPRRDEVEEKVSIYESDRRSAAGSGFEETRIIRKERERTPERIERDIRVERYERSPEPPRRYEREYRYERDVEREKPRREPYELDRYIKTTEYFPPAPRASVVVPVPPREEEDFQMIRRSEVIDDRQLARREPQPQEEDYYYERRVREADDDRHSDEYRDVRSRRGRTVSPHDSISRRDYSSDDSIVYIKKEVREERGSSPRHRRHLAEGAVAGLGAAELIRHHRKKEGEEVGGRGSRIGKDLAAAGAGVVGAEMISRVRSRHRSKSRHGSPERESRRRHRHGHERSRSRSRVKQLAGLGIGAAAIAAAVGYARHKNNEKNKQDPDRRSRSRTRRNSTSAVPDGDPRDPKHRNTRMAQAGLAGAAIAGLVERARSKSRSGRSRSQSRVRQGIPIAAAGLGSAAIAGLYEKSQANKREKAAREAEEAHMKRRSSRSRSRSAMPYDGPRAASASDPGLIEYGEAPVYSNGGVPDYYNRPASQAGFYPPPMDPGMVPVAAAAIPYATRVTEVRERETGDRSGGERESHRRRDYSSESDDGERRRRHRRRKSGDGSRSRSQSRTRELATAGLAAAGAALGATQYAKRKERKRAEKERERTHLNSKEMTHKANSRLEYDAENPAYNESEGYSPGPYSPLSPPVQNLPAPNYQPEAFYPNTNTFPPPPNANAQYSPQPAYNPADYAPPPNTQPIHPDYGYPQQQPYTPPQGVYSPPPANPYAPGATRGAGRGDENVSADPYLNTAHTRDQHNVEDGG